jgi:acyl dehydratase
MTEKPDLLTFEDFPPGRFGTFGPRHVTREEIIEFAREFDPQPMHLDDAAAEASMLKGLSGSGWHVCSLTMRMLYDGFIHRTKSLGSPGVAETKWMSPLRPGDDLILDVDVAESRLSQSRPGTGIVTFHLSLTGAAGKIAEMTPTIMVGCRDNAAAKA